MIIEALAGRCRIATLRLMLSISVAAGAVATPAAAIPVAPATGLSDIDTLLQRVNEETGVSKQATDAIVKDIRSVVADCKRYDVAYRVDCLAQGLKEVSRRMPGGDYQQARSIISKAAGKLSSLVRANADSDQPKLDAPSGANPRLKSKRRYTAIKKEALATVMKEAQAIIQEAETQLLRSAENSAKRQAHYQQIATAISSTKVLLRS